MRRELEISTVLQHDPAQVLPAHWDPDALYEIVNGEYREVPPMGKNAGRLATALSAYLWIFGTQAKLGQPAVEVVFRLSANDPSRRPDVAFVYYDRMRAADDADQDPPQWEVVPNLAVEIISPTNSFNEIEEKLHDYFRAGVQFVWVVVPLHKRIYLYTSLTQVRVIEEKDELSGEPVLPGFRLPVSELFGALAKPA